MFVDVLAMRFKQKALLQGLSNARKTELEVAWPLVFQTEYHKTKLSQACAPGAIAVQDVATAGKNNVTWYRTELMYMDTKSVVLR